MTYTAEIKFNVSLKKMLFMSNQYSINHQFLSVLKTLLLHFGN